MIQLFHVSKTYERHRALHDINLTIEKGDFVLLMGPSGAGKTTLLKLLFCAEVPDEGQILVQNRNIARFRGTDVPYFRRSMGFVFQDFKLLPKRNVFDNVALPLLVQGASSFEIRRRVSEALKAVGIDHKKESKPVALSAGEQQRVSIARAIVSGPVVLLADEPTGNMDSDLASEIIELFKAINARGTTVVVATHNSRIVDQVRRRVIHLHQGQVLSDPGMRR